MRIQLAYTKICGMKEALLIGCLIAQSKNSGDLIRCQGIEPFTLMGAARYACDRHWDEWSRRGSLGPKHAAGHELCPGTLSFPGIAIVNSTGTVDQRLAKL